MFHKIEAPRMYWSKLKEARMVKLKHIEPKEVYFYVGGIGKKILWNEAVIKDTALVDYSLQIKEDVLIETIKNHGSSEIEAVLEITKNNITDVEQILFPAIGIIEHGIYTNRSNKEVPLLSLLNQFILDDTKSRLASSLVGNTLYITRDENATRLYIKEQQNDYLYFHFANMNGDTTYALEEAKISIQLAKDLLNENRIQLLYH